MRICAQRSYKSLFARLLVVGWITAVHAAQPAYLDAMPSVDLVLKTISSNDAAETAARRAGTFTQLNEIIREMAGERFYANKLTDDEIKLANSYRAAEAKILSEYPNTFNPEETRKLGMNSPRAKWFDRYYRYGRDSDYVLKKFFTADWQNNYYKQLKQHKPAVARTVNSQSHAASKKDKQEMSDSIFTTYWQGGLISGIFLVLGVVSIMLLKKKLMQNLAADAVAISHKSWTAYLLSTMVFMIFLVVINPYIWNKNYLASLIVTAVMTLWWVYRQLDLSSYQLYYDVTGVWMKHGIFPWSRVVSGVKWRDLDEAVYYPGFIHFILRSYTIHLRHRYTKDSEIMLSHMQRGDRAVATINTIHHEKISSNSLT